MSKMSNIHVVAQETFEYLKQIYTLDEIYESPSLVLHVAAYLEDRDSAEIVLVKEAVKNLAYEAMKGSLSYAVW